MSVRLRALCTALALAGSGVVALASPAAALPISTPVCTDGFRGGPPLAECGGRIFPESALTQAYVQYRPNALGFKEYADGLAYLEQVYSRYIDVFTLAEHFKDKNAVSTGPDGIRAGEKGDTGDGKDIYVIHLTDKTKPSKDKKRLFFSLSVHGNERGGLEGGLRAVEDLAIAAQNPDLTISDGVPGYTSNTGKKPVFHEYSVRSVLGKEDVYLTDFNIDGWTIGDVAPPGATNAYARANGSGVDLNRQMPTVGRIDTSRNPMQEKETAYGVRLMNEIAAQAPGGLMAYGADIHGELTSRAYVDIMYPAGQFDSVKHRQLMAIAERTKSVIDATLYAGIQDQIENETGGDEGEGVEGLGCDFAPTLCPVNLGLGNTIPTKPAHWATVWDTLGYTDTGFIGDYLATNVAVTGMDYEIFLNHTVPDKVWNVYLQENHINASRAIIKTAMAYALYQDEEFSDRNVKVETGGQAGYVLDPSVVTDKDGIGNLGGPKGDGIGRDGKKVVQQPYSADRTRFFTQTSRLMAKPFRGIASGDIARDPKVLDVLDTLVVSDIAVPKDAKGRSVSQGAYFKNIKAWVNRGGNLVLTDRALSVAASLGLVPSSAVKGLKVYQPYTDFQDFTDPLAAGLRKNARQLVEAPALGYGIGNTASPMTGIDPDAFTAAKGKVVGTTNGDVTLGRLRLGKGQVQLIGGALPTPTEDNDHRFGLRDFALTYSGLYVMENAVRYDAAGLGAAAPASFRPSSPSGAATGGSTSLPATGAEVPLAAFGLLLGGLAVLARRRSGQPA